MTSEQGPNDVASDGWRRPPTPKLTEDHFICLRAAERGQGVDTNRLRLRIAVCECRRWSLILASSPKLTPLGEQALAKHRSEIAKRRTR